MFEFISAVILLQMSNDIIYSFLGILLLVCLFFIVSYFFNSIDKKKKILHEQFINGRWRRQGHTEEGTPWAFEIAFHGQFLEMKGQPEYWGTARYKAVKEVESLIILQMSEMEGDLEGQHPILQVGINRRSGLIYIDKRVYQKVDSSIIGTD